MEIYIPHEIIKVKGLNITEKVVLSIYKYYTEKGKYKCCSLTNRQIADELDITIWYMDKIKKHLKELGYIKSSGIKVTYLGVKDCNIVQSESVIEYSGSVIEYSEDCNIVQSESVIEYTHKKEKEEKKEIKKKKEEEIVVSNIKLIFGNEPDSLPKEYHTKENVQYIMDKYKERLNEVDLNECGALKSWTDNLRNELTYPMKYHIEKPEPVSDTIDVL